MKKPSFLIAEDGRGRGVLEAMGMPGVIGWQKPPLLVWCQQKQKSPKICNRIRNIWGRISCNPKAHENLKNIITEELAHNFTRFKSLKSIIDCSWTNMLRLLKELPM